jgi:two-component system, OmpR family, response regulator
MATAFQEQPINLEHVRYMFIIDDDPIQREMIKDYMNDRYLFEVKTYDNGEDAQTAIQELSPEIIILDYYLNSHIPTAKNGIEVLKDIRQWSPKTKVVMFSGEDKIEVARESKKHGAFDFVVKGESAFPKIEKVIDILGEMHRNEAIQKAQKRTIAFLAGVIIAILAGVILFYMKNQE